MYVYTVRASARACWGLFPGSRPPYPSQFMVCMVPVQSTGFSPVFHSTASKPNLPATASLPTSCQPFPSSPLFLSQNHHHHQSNYRLLSTNHTCRLSCGGEGGWDAQNCHMYIGHSFPVWLSGPQTQRQPYQAKNRKRKGSNIW